MQIVIAIAVVLLLAGFTTFSFIRTNTEPAIMSVHTSELLIPGPASGLEAGEVNRLGSDEVPVRVYTPDTAPWATLVWAHGGSFVRGTLDMPEADWAARRFAEQGLRVVSVDYALATETVKAPAPANDVTAAALWAATEFRQPLLLGGASAGANLATQAALTLPNFGTRQPGVSPGALILLYPTLHRVQQPHAEIEALVRDVPEQSRFTPERIAEMYKFYLGEDTGPTVSADTHGFATEPTVVGELEADQLRQLPPTIVVNAETDELRASGEQFVTQLQQAQVPVSQHLAPGTQHGYMNRPEENANATSLAQASIDIFVRELLLVLKPPEHPA